MAITSKINPANNLTYWKDDSTTPPTEWKTNSTGKVIEGVASKGWTPPKTNTSNTVKTPVNKGDYIDYGITMWKGDQLESTDLATGKKSKDWNIAKIRTNNKELNRLATKLKFDPSKWEGKDINEKFQHFLYSNPLPGTDFKTLIDTEHGTEPGVGHGTPQFSKKMFDGLLGTRWLDAIAKMKTPDEEPIVGEKAKSKDIIPNHNQQYSNETAYAPFWLQDVINTASAAGTRAGLKKYLPWAPQVELQTPRPTFFDPTRELANNTEQMQIGTEGAGMFAGPQAFNSRFAGIQGQGAKNAANILANYHNKNVGVANTFENLRADIYNRNNQGNAAVAQKLYDGTTIANQQFDNSKRKANAELRESYINALTNRGKTQTLNSIYPHYQVHPETGGLTTWDGGSDIEDSNYQDKAKQFYTLMNDPRMDAETARAIVGISGDGRSSNPKSDYFNSYLDSAPKSKYGGESEDSYLDSYRKMKSIFK